MHLVDELTRQNVQLLNEAEQAKGAFDNLLETWGEELTQTPYNFEEHNRMKAVVEAANKPRPSKLAFAVSLEKI